MKTCFISLLTALALSLSATAQSIQFLQPADGVTLTPGQNFSIQIGQPMELSGFANAAVTFGYLACQTGSDVASQCPNVAAVPDQGVGEVLETFVFQPQLSQIPWIPPNQNFTIEFPSYATGKGVLSATLFYFGSAGLAPMFTVANITVNAA
ncbi:hypothetical protein CALVIDRAFT_541430 [Calocera viscosa TUFC12733]|uniref:Phosphatidylglycerol/phosphatidylinositol transfer protein n=1 Tax=Calocera viscosa (strain TUFC12733) TaxID=1330018 RepID=A0A167HSU3_CALVF|nr:hypothetical protein CALVIDRAFT_541430 [Calocera viscosa TUFC12733]